MDANNKLLIKNTAFLFIRMGFSMVVSLFTSRILLNTIGAVDYGIYNVIAGFIVIMTFINGALSTASMRFITSALGRNERENLEKAFNCSFYLHLFGGGVSIVLAETIGLYFFSTQMNIPIERSFAATLVFHFASIQLLFKFLNIPFNAVLIAHEKMNLFAYTGITISSIQFVGVYTLRFWGMDHLVLYAVLTLSLDVLIFIFYFVYCHRKFSECTYKFVREKSYYHSIISFLGFDLIGNFASIIQTQGLNVLLNIYGGPLLNASRAISYQVEGSLRNFSDNFMTALKPQIIKSYARKDFEQTMKLIYRGAILSFTLFGVLCLPLIFNLNYIIELWLKMVPVYVLPFTKVVLLTTIEFTIHLPFLYLIIASGRNKWTNITAGLSLALSFFAIWLVLAQGLHPVWAFGMVWLFRIITDFATYAMIQHLQLIMPFSIFYIIKRLYIPLYSAFALGAIAFFLINKIEAPHLLHLCIGIIFGNGVFISCIYFLAFSQSEKMFLHRKLLILQQKLFG